MQEEGGERGARGGAGFFFKKFSRTGKKEKQIKAKGAQTRPVMFGEGIFGFDVFSQRYCQIYHR